MIQLATLALLALVFFLVTRPDGRHRFAAASVYRRRTW